MSIPSIRDRAVRLALLVLLGVALAPADSSGQSERSKAERIRVAQELYSDAMKAFEAGQYEKAIEGFQAADALYPDPIFDYNIAVCWSALGEPMKALEAAERVADADLPTDNSVKNEARILAFRRLRSARDVSRSVSLAPPEATVAEPEGGWEVLDGVALGVAGVGVVGLGATWIISARVAALADEVEAANRNGEFERAQRAEERGRPLQRTGRIVGVLSAVTALAGVTWFLVRRIGGSEAVTWSVTPGPGEIRAVLGVRF